MRTSQQGRDRIKKHEALRLVSYRDAVGVWTIGWGNTGSEYAREGVRISKSKAQALFDGDIAEAEAIVDKAVSVPLSQEQYDALVSFVFNIGPGSKHKDGFVRLKNGKPSTLLRLLNEGKYEAAAQQFNRWVYGGGRILGGLVKRRAEETALFLEGTTSEVTTTSDTGPESGVIGESAPKGNEAPAAAALGGVAAVAAPLLQAASGATPALVATIFAALAAAYLIWKLTKEDE
jgi:lysozyme